MKLSDNVKLEMSSQEADNIKRDIAGLLLSQLRLGFLTIQEVEKAYPHAAKLVYELADLRSRALSTGPKSLG
jgi:hypothetical protein